MGNYWLDREIKETNWFDGKVSIVFSNGISYEFWESKDEDVLMESRSTNAPYLGYDSELREDQWCIAEKLACSLFAIFGKKSKGDYMKCLRALEESSTSDKAGN
jgi:hypothetical protein